MAADGTPPDLRFVEAAKQLVEQGYRWDGRRWKAPERSSEHHGLFFLVVREAFKNWPSTHAFQPQSAEELRGWLLVEAGWCTTGEVEINKSNRASLTAAIAALRALHGLTRSTTPYKRMIETPKGLRVYVPKSIAKGEIGKAEFERVGRVVFEIVTTALGCSIEQLQHQAKWGVQ